MHLAALIKKPTGTNELRTLEGVLNAFQHNLEAHYKVYEHCVYIDKITYGSEWINLVTALQINGFEVWAVIEPQPNGVVEILWPDDEESEPEGMKRLHEFIKIKFRRKQKLN